MTTEMAILGHMSRTIAEIRNEAATALSAERQQQLEQFFTPMPVAEQAAGLFSHTDAPVRILDLGSGTGILGAVVAGQSARGSSVTAIEKDPDLIAYSEDSLQQVCDDVRVINASVFDVWLDAEFDRVILNPPYKKIKPMVIGTASGGVKVTNLYTAFLVIAIQALADGGECVAIVPRSWMNGEYFKDFRKWLLAECSLDAVAVYGSRQEHFKDMDILQEIMLLKVSKRPQVDTVTIYDDASPTTPLSEQHADSMPLASLLLGRDHMLRIRQQDDRLIDFKPLCERGLWVSTGKLVWFRNRDILSDADTPGGYPLYWMDNQDGLVTEHPVQCERPQWTTEEAANRNIVLPAGSYCFVGRFSAKEQLRRIHASYLGSEVPFVVDNKLNYIHRGTSRTTVPLDDAVARGLTLWLSTSIVDEWYRQISGSTQVNATDLRQLPCPEQRQLAALADLLPIDGHMDQMRVDQTVGRMFSWVETS